MVFETVTNKRLISSVCVNVIHPFDPYRHVGAWAVRCDPRASMCKRSSLVRQGAYNAMNRPAMILFLAKVCRASLITHYS
jgi:hypothetical protein